MKRRRVRHDEQADQLDYLYLDAGTNSSLSLSLSLSPLLRLLLDEKNRARVSRLLSNSRRCSLADLAKDWAIIKSWKRAAETYIARSI